MTPWTAACQASLSITNLRSLLKPMSTELVMPSNHLILCHSPFFLPSIFFNIRVFSTESVLHLRWPKHWSFSFSISPSHEYSGLISFRWTGLIFLQSKGFSRVFSNTRVQKQQFFGVQLSLCSNSRIHTWLLEKPSLWLEIRYFFDGKEISLLFNMLLKFITAFLLRSKGLLISWLRSLSVVILES